MRKNVLALIFGLAVLPVTLATFSQAQDSVTPDPKKAVLVLELDTRFLPKGPSLSQLSFQPPGMDRINLQDIKRIYGAASAPTDLQGFQNTLTTRILTFDVFLQVQFNSVELADKAFNQAKTAYAPKMIDGKQMYSIVVEGNAQAPKNVLVHRFSPDTIELGTEGYLSSPNRNLLSQRLVEMWSKTSPGWLRVAFDMDAVRPLIEEDRESKPVPIVVHPSIVLVDCASVIGVGLNTSGDDGTLQLKATSRDAKSKKTLYQILDGMGKQHVERAEASVSPIMRKAGLAKIPTVETRQVDDDVVVTMTMPPSLLNAAAGVLEPPRSTEPKKFDPQAWRDGQEGNSRLRMVDSLEATLKVGMPMEEVIKLLGKPSSKSDQRLIYGLGRGLIDHEE